MAKQNIKQELQDVSIPMKFKLWALAVAILGFLLYLNTVKNNFALDDNNSIIQNNYVQEGISGIPKLMTIDYWYFQGLKLGYYRPLSLITFAIEKSFFGTNPHVNHFDNALLYGLTGFLLFLFLFQLFPKKHPAFSFLICFIFMAHPIHTEVVANIKSRDEILSFLNILAMCFFAFRYVKTNKKSDLVWSLVLTYLALLSKETAMLGVLLLGIFLIFSGKTISDTFKKILPYGGVILFFLLQKQYFLPSSKQKIPDDITNYPYLGSAVKLPSAFHMFWLYIQKLIIPSNLCYDYSYNQIPASHKGDAVVWLGVIMLAGLAIVVLRGYKKRNVWSLAAAIYLITIAPAIAFVVFRGGIMAERFLYAPVLGFAIALVYALSKKTKAASDPSLPVMQYARLNPELLIVTFLLVSIYSYATIKRNPEWKDNITLFGADVKKATNSTQAHRLYGNELINLAHAEKDTAKKRTYFIEGMNQLRSSANINPKFGETYEQMGYAYTEVYLNVDSALYYYKKCISVSSFALAYNNLGAIYQNMGKLKLASYYFNRALEINPNEPNAKQHSADLKRQTGLDIHQFPGEDEMIRKQTIIPGLRETQGGKDLPQDFKMNFDAGHALLVQGKYKEAIPYFEKAQKIQPKNLDIMLFLANCSGMAKDYPKAISTFEKMLTLSPSDTVVMNNLAQTYRVVGENAKADELMKRKKNLWK